MSLKTRSTKICLVFLILLSLIPTYGLTQGKFPASQGYVSDYAGVISPNAKSILTNLLKELEQKTQAEVAIVTLPDLGDNALEPYAVDLFAKWGIGKKGKDNGLLILLAIKERKARIEVGYGLEGLIPDGLAGEIIRTQMAPFFKKGDYDSGLLQATSFIATTIAKEAGVTLKLRSPVHNAPPVSRRRGRSSGALNLIFLIIMIILFIRHPRLFFWFMMGSMLGGGRRGHWSSGGGGFGGGFGGFGGGMSGGGGASGGW